MATCPGVDDKDEETKSSTRSSVLEWLPIPQNGPQETRKFSGVITLYLEGFIGPSCTFNYGAISIGGITV